MTSLTGAEMSNNCRL